jgi:drug/metabolite transporter (DMT)-like permease
MKTNTVLAAAVAAALTDVAADPTTAMKGRDVPIATDVVVQQIAPTIEHLANAEPWYRSRVTWGAIVAAGAGLAGIAGVALDAEDQQVITDGIMAAIQIGVAVASLAGGAIAWYGRWKAKRPIGR